MSNLKLNVTSEETVADAPPQELTQQNRGPSEGPYLHAPSSATKRSTRSRAVPTLSASEIGTLLVCCIGYSTNMDRLVSLGLLKQKRADSQDSGGYSVTEKGSVYIDMLEKVPMPVQAWKAP